MKPLYLVFKDEQYSFQGISHTRLIARALLENADGRFAFHHILADDRFGHRDYLETLGGGVEAGETLEEGVLREVEEEAGLKAKILTKIGVIEDDYHLIQRHNLNHYFYLKVIGQGHQAWTPQEHRLIHAQRWLTLEEAIAWYSRLPDQGISQLIKQRELPVLNWLKAYLASRK